MSIYPFHCRLKVIEQSSFVKLLYVMLTRVRGLFCGRFDAGTPKKTLIVFAA